MNVQEGVRVRAERERARREVEGERKGIDWGSKG